MTIHFGRAGTIATLLTTISLATLAQAQQAIAPSDTGKIWSQDRSIMTPPVSRAAASRPSRS
jgi:hypothetical protein